jgi:hypothetical protein
MGVFDLPEVNLQKQLSHYKKQCQLQVNGISTTFIHVHLVKNTPEPIAFSKNPLATGLAP